MGNYRELVVWRRSHQLALQIYHATGAFPSGERYGLTGQLRRGSVSVTSNIVEGSARQTDPEQIRFLRIAHGALCEMQCQLLLARDLEFLEPGTWKVLDEECQSLGKMLNAFIRRLRRGTVVEV
jgi:four helix bundle protein